MQLGLVGLGRMGANMAKRLVRNGHTVVGMARHDSTVQGALKEGAISSGTTSLADLVKQLDTPRAIWLMVPAASVDATLTELVPLLSPGDLVVDGGNSYYHDDIRRAAELKPKGIHYMDTGTSGGVWGLERGYCLMIGGEQEAFERMKPIYEALAPGVGAVERTPGRESMTGSTAEKGYLLCGPVGAGHFVKMVHNGVEYGMLQAYGEGFEIIEKSPFAPDLREVTRVWQNGSVVRSWLLDLAALAFAEDPKLEKISGYVEDSGEGRWTVQAAIDEDVPAPVITLSLLQRFVSRQKESFSAKVIAALRNQFGGHAVKFEDGEMGGVKHQA